MRSLDFRSLAIHSGQATTVRLSVSPGDAQVFIRSSTLLDEEMHAGDKIYLDRLDNLTAMHASNFKLSSGRELRTVEHFLCALSLFYPSLKASRLNLWVYLDHDEFPILDGTMGVWWNGLHQLCEVTPPTFLFVEDYNSSFSVKISFAGKTLQWDSHHPLKMLNLLQAPTFSSWTEYEKAKSLGLVKGGRPNNAHVYQGDPKRPYPLTWGQSIYPHRIDPTSFCAHKFVDFIGDLAILSLKFPSGHYEVQEGGHYKHHQILKGIYHDIS